MTTAVRVGVQLPEVEREVRWPGYVAMALEAERAGFDSVWVGDHLLYRDDGRPERGPWEAWTTLAAIAQATERVELGPLVACAGFHAPAMLAKQAATVDEISDGRVILGLGTSGKLVIENFHGVPYDKPLTRLRETVNILRALWRGDRLSPELSTLMDLRHFKLEMKPSRPDIPIYIASLQEKAIREVGRIADGWVPTFWPYDHFKEGLDWIAAGARDN